MENNIFFKKNVKKKRELVNLKFQPQVQQMHYSSRECCIAVTSDLLLFSRSVMSNSLQLWPHGLQHARLPRPSPSPIAYSDSCPLSRWCHPTILSSVVPFSPCPESFPASGSFLMSRLLASSGQSIGVLALALPMNIQSWFHLGLTGLISLQVIPALYLSSHAKIGRI